MQSMSNVTVAQARWRNWWKQLGLSQSADGATSCLQGGTTSPACATSDGGNGNGGTGLQAA